jgi:signal transduction histidine kinase
VRIVRPLLVYVALWSPVALGFAVALALTEHLAWPLALTAGTMSTLPGALMGVAVIALCVRLPWRETNRVAFVLVHALTGLAYTAIWSGAIVTEMWLAAPRAETTKFFRDGLAWQLLTGAIVYALLAGVAYARGALVSADLSARAAERAEMLRLRAELSALRARLDPHFLFNVLQTLGALVNERPETAHAALEHLAALLKRRIDAAAVPGDAVLLADELADARQYLALESLRFGNRLAAEEDVEPATLAFMIPKFTLQPLVENAIRHGLSQRASGGRVTITTRANGSSWTLSVSDDGIGADASRFITGTGVGISVLRERLRLQFGGDAALSVQTAIGEGCTVSVRLPIDTDEAA